MNWWKVRSSCGLPVAGARVRRVGAASGSIAVRVGGVVDGARQRLECPAVDVLGGRERHRLGRPAVVAVAEGEDRRPAGRDARELDRGLDRLRARVRQERLPRPAGQDVLEPLVEPQPRLVVDDVLLAVQELARLRRDRGRDARVGVTGVGDADPRRVVEVAPAIAGDQPRPLAAVDIEVRDPAPDRGHHAVVGEVGERRLGRRSVRRGIDHDRLLRCLRWRAFERSPRRASSAAARRASRWRPGRRRSGR